MNDAMNFQVRRHFGKSISLCLMRSTVQDMAKSRDLPVLREFRDVMTTLTSSGDAGDRTTSPAVDQSESLLKTRQVTCTDMLMTSRGSLLATGCTNGDVIVWDVSNCEPYIV